MQDEVQDGSQFQDQVLNGMLEKMQQRGARFC